jgi:hypothetical protein
MATLQQELPAPAIAQQFIGSNWNRAAVQQFPR